MPSDPLTPTPGIGRRVAVAPPTVDYAIEAYRLKKLYRTRRGKQAAVDGLDLRVPIGGVHGFLGPNGSGKTTTIRMLLGLIAADAGHIRIFDHEVPLAIDQIIDRVGAIIEQPKFFPPFSGQRILSCWPARSGRGADALTEYSRKWDWAGAVTTSSVVTHLA